MEHFKTLNNHICKLIIYNAVSGNYRAVYLLIYNYHDLLCDELFVRVYNLCYEIAPLTLDVYNTLPNDVKSYYSQLWSSSIKTSG